MEPFGEWRADVRSAQIALVTHNVMADEKHKLKIQDFIPDWLDNYDEAVKKAEEEAKRRETSRPRQTPEEQLAIAYMWARALARTTEAA